MCVFGLSAIFITLLMSWFVFNGACYVRKKCFCYLPNKTNASQKEKCDVLELYKTESIKYQAPKRIRESASFQKRFPVKMFKRLLIELSVEPLQWFITCFVHRRNISRITL